MHVEGANVVRARDVVAALLLVGAAVGDIQHALIGGEREAVGLVEVVGEDRQAIAGSGS